MRWHALGIAEVETALETRAHGLGAHEVEARFLRHGPNELEEAPPPGVFAVILHQFKSPLIYILLVAAVVTVAIGELVDAAVIAAVLALNAIIGFTQERRAESAVRALRGLVAPKARVVRDGEEREVESRALVPGDVVLLESGGRVPADVRLASATELRIDESLLTGESLPVQKRADPLPESTVLADRVNLAHAGSIVTSGRGRGFVIATGTHTEIGAIAGQVREAKSPETPLQQAMNRFARLVGVAVAVAVAIAFVLGLALGETLSHMFLVAVGLAVAAIPEGLPVVFTITLAIGVRRMARRNAIVRRLPAVETLGSTTVIGSDKTGTLTENRMTVQEVWAGGRSFDSSNIAEHRPLYLALLASVLANEADAYRTEEGLRSVGDPTEAALVVSALRLGLEPAEMRARYESLAELPFESERQYSASLRSHDGRALVFVKGAPERVLAMSTRMATQEGETDLDPEVVRAAAEAMASKALRLIATAYAVLPERPAPGEGIPPPERLVFLGLHGMMDPPRSGVREAIEGCREAGVRVVMITGDHAATAVAIGRELGRAADDTPALTGRELDEIGEDELRDRARETSIYARVAPAHKLRVVRALQANGEVVAVTGDGVNDAPALKAADIGVSMGKSGTDVAREASDMVLTDDNFVSIYAAVEEGRVTFDNLRKVTFFLISTGVAAILTILTSLALGWPIPFLPAQLLWMNLVTNGLQDVALAFEPGERDVLRRPPRARGEGIVSRMLWERTVLVGIVMAAGTLVLFQWELGESGSLSRAQTVALTTMVLFQNFHVGNARSDYESAFRRSVFSNPFLLVAAVSALAIHTAALYLPPTQLVLRVEPIDAAAWIRIVAVAATIILVVEAHKLLRKRRS